MVTDSVYISNSAFLFLSVCVCVRREIQFLLKPSEKKRTHIHIQNEKFEAREHKRITCLFRVPVITFVVLLFEDGFVYRISG